MKFGLALEYLQDGETVAREGWNGKNMFLFRIDNWTYTDGKHDNYENLPFIALKTADNKVIPWNASQADVQATDWVVKSTLGNAQ